jgi:hypothetical protein
MAEIRVTLSDFKLSESVSSSGILSSRGDEGRDAADASELAARGASLSLSSESVLKSLPDHILLWF